jgi:hypothetical protein
MGVLVCILYNVLGGKLMSNNPSQMIDFTMELHESQLDFHQLVILRRYLTLFLALFL